MKSEMQHKSSLFKNKFYYLFLLIMMLITLFISFLTMGNAYGWAKAEKVEDMLDNYADYYSGEVEYIDSLLRDMEQEVIKTFNIDNFNSNTRYITQYKNSITPVIKRYAQATHNTKNAYFYFNPRLNTEKIAMGKNDIWFLDSDSDGSVERQKQTPALMLLTEKLLWFNEKKQTKSLFWEGPFSLNENKQAGKYFSELDKYIFISRIKRIYIDGHFIGIVGIDIIFDDLKKEFLQNTLYRSETVFMLSRENMQLLMQTRDTSVDELDIIRQNIQNTDSFEKTSMVYKLKNGKTKTLTCYILDANVIICLTIDKYEIAEGIWFIVMLAVLLGLFIVCSYPLKHIDRKESVITHDKNVV